MNLLSSIICSSINLVAPSSALATAHRNRPKAHPYSAPHPGRSLADPIAIPADPRLDRLLHHAEHKRGGRPSPLAPATYDALCLDMADWLREGHPTLTWSTSEYTPSTVDSLSFWLSQSDVIARRLEGRRIATTYRRDDWARAYMDAIRFALSFWQAYGISFGKHEQESVRASLRALLEWVSTSKPWSSRAYPIPPTFISSPASGDTLPPIFDTLNAFAKDYLRWRLWARIESRLTPRTPPRRLLHCSHRRHLSSPME